MSKVKMRCARCSKPFKSSDAKQTLCPDCSAKERLARAKGPTSQPAPAKHVPPPKIIGPTAGAQFTPPPDTGAFGAAARRADHEPQAHRDHGRQPAAGAPAGHGAAAPPDHPHPAAASAGHVAPARLAHERGTAAGGGGAHGAGHMAGHGAAGRGTAAARPPREPKPPKERKPAPPQELTAEQRAAVEQRYLELAQPAEFDGIRSQIASELGLPKALVRKAILELRQNRGLPSWWEMQGFPGSADELERLREAYVRLLPVPPIGVHKQLAAQLGLEPHAAYKGIRQIRAQMGLPQFNPPEQHPEYKQPEAAAAPAGAAAPGAERGAGVSE